MHSIVYGGSSWVGIRKCSLLIFIIKENKIMGSFLNYFYSFFFLHKFFFDEKISVKKRCNAEEETAWSPCTHVCVR